MQIVIEISEKIFEELTKYDEFVPSGNRLYDSVLSSIYNGTPLPKGHGDLIDKNDLLEYTDINRCAYTPTINRYDIITTPTIIKAEGSNKE